MMKGRQAILCWGIPVAGLLLLALGLEGMRSSGQGAPPGGKARETLLPPFPGNPREGPRAGKSPERDLVNPPKPVAMAAPLKKLGTESPGEQPWGETLEESFVDLRVALILHDRATGERAYPILRNHRAQAVARAEACLREAQDPSDREVAERAIRLLSAPPTHGLLRHFEW